MEVGKEGLVEAWTEGWTGGKGKRGSISLDQDESDGTRLTLRKQREVRPRLAARRRGGRTAQT